MASSSNAQSTEVGYISSQNALPTISNFAECSQSPLEPKVHVDDDEKVNFNPFLKETLSPEASSSLSSEVYGLDADVSDGQGNTLASIVSSTSKPTGDIQESDVRDSELGEEEIVMENIVSPRRSCQKELDKGVLGKLKNRKSVLICQPEIGSYRDKDSGSSSGTDVVNDVEAGGLHNTTYSRNPSVDFDDGGAICMRTRARYSLANFSLDELETFLQETDDENELQNVDDEGEYRKFLAAVLQGGCGDSQANQENESVDDEDEANDADFQIEIEEAFESDLDESTWKKAQKDVSVGAGRRPQTRQKTRQVANAKNKKQLLQQAKRPLRPKLSIMSNFSITASPIFDRRSLTPGTAPHCPSYETKNGIANYFTPHQIGQLYCLIHEHVQLLLQVFTLCVFEPSRQQIAYEVQELISEMLRKRDQVLAWSNMQYPSCYFRPPFVHPSVSNGLPQYTSESFVHPSVSNGLPQYTSESSPTSDVQRDCSSSDMPPYKYHSNMQTGSYQSIDGYFWGPLVIGPILSILDVAPLKLVRRYMVDVKIAVQEYQRRHVGATYDTRFEKKPLFPFPNFTPVTDSRDEVVTDCITQSATVTPSISPSCEQPKKKTLAGSLVESSMRQSVALVPKEIVDLAQRFFPLFNSALFPHKPPPAPVANRVLFTDAEDELLAMGLMEYNTDWKAIQQRFLPCHTEHQIFVRQKNRSSSKAPENPIKAVRKMKTSPLTAEEQERIREGLRVFMSDWMSICKFFLPHRDPSLLPRQWRIALGTQKSYKSDPAKKEARRLYEAERRKCKAAELASWEIVSEKENYQTESAGGMISGINTIDNEDEAYVHEAFLADWRPGSSNFCSSVLQQSSLGEKDLPSYILSQQGTHVQGQLNNISSGESQPQKNNMNELAAASSHHTDVRHCTSDTMKLNHPVPDLTFQSSKSLSYLRPYRAGRMRSARLVKLAPDLPPVNLPSSVRIISQSAFKSYGSGALSKVSVAGDDGGIETALPSLPHVRKSGTALSVEATQNKSSLEHDSTKTPLEQSGVLKDTESDLQMHPLLFRPPKDGQLPYYPLNCSASTSSSFSLFLGNQPQVQTNLFHYSHQENPCFYNSSKSKETALTSPGIDFHPLLQRTDGADSDMATVCSTDHISFDLATFRGESAQCPSSYDAVQTESLITSCPPAPGTERSSPSELANELDLEIHLSSTSRNEKDSLPEIVMEEEELSDSDEDFGEAVEFEREEMADSEGEEGPENQQIADIHNKKAAEEVLRDDGQCARRRKDKTVSLKLGFTSEGNQDISSWLSLDSCPKPKLVKEASYRPRRSCTKKLTPVRKPRKKRVCRTNIDLNKFG